MTAPVNANTSVPFAACQATASRLPGPLLVVVVLAVAPACSKCSSKSEQTMEQADRGKTGDLRPRGLSTGEPGGEERSGAGEELEQKRQREQQEQREQRERMEKQFPLHGLVTGLQLNVRMKPDPDATVVGWLRIGSRVRLAPEPTRSATCHTGWHRVYPLGWACAGEGIVVADAPPDSPLAVTPAPRDAALPYQYYFVKEPLVPEYHRLPSRNEQRAALAFARRYLELRQINERRAERFRSGELPDEPSGTAVAAKYLERGFFVAGAGIEKRAFRRFVRTVRGRYIKLAQLEQRSGSSFSGVRLDDPDNPRTLPVAWAVRSGRPFRPRQREDGTLRLVADEQSDPVERLTVLPWVERERIGERIFYKLEDGRYLKLWFVAVAEQFDPDKEIDRIKEDEQMEEEERVERIGKLRRIKRMKRSGQDEPWIHIDLSQQTLVLYRGGRPVYATLLSSGLEGFETSTGVFTIRSKHVADTMADLGPDAGDERYKIEDVPWTQYFSGSIAIHGAFWHERFGLRRSHGCINLSPLDAHRVFDHTWPVLPDGWHGVSTDRTGLDGSTVVITE